MAAFFACTEALIPEEHRCEASSAACSSMPVNEPGIVFGVHMSLIQQPAKKYFRRQISGGISILIHSALS
jgi:hypothetical protein